MWDVSKAMGFRSRCGTGAAAKPRPSKQFLRQQNIVCACRPGEIRFTRTSTASRNSAGEKRSFLLSESTDSPLPSRDTQNPSANGRDSRKLFDAGRYSNLHVIRTKIRI